MKPHEMTPQQIADTLIAFETIKSIAEKVKEHAIALAHSGVEIPGFKPSFTSARRGWPSNEIAVKTLTEAGLTEAEAYAPVEPLSPAQAEKLLKAKKLWPKCKRGSAEEDFTSDPLESAVVYSDAKPSIKRV